MFADDELDLMLESGDVTEVESRTVELEELELDCDENPAPVELDEAISLEGVELEQEMHFLRQHFCVDESGIPFFLLVEGEYFRLGEISVDFKTILSLASVGAGYRLFLHLDGKKISLTDPENIIRLISL